MKEWNNLWQNILGTISDLIHLLNEVDQQIKWVLKVCLFH